TSSMPEAMTQLSTITQNAGLTLESIAPSTDKEKDEKDNLTINLSLSGDFVKFKDWLAKSENNLRPIKITSLTINGLENSILATLSLKMPYLGEKTATNE
ncbi:MAG: hypothetical protein CEN88_365, partial [Candidatus Berkelbacteria bacterium Licking1014_2]